MVEPDPLNLLPLQVSHEARHSKPQELPEVVSGEQFSHSYVLESVRLPRENAVVPQTIIPIEVIPFNRLVNDSKQLEGINKTYSAAAMTGPLTDPRDLFSKLNIDNDFRAQPAQAGGSIRTSSDAFSYGAEWMPVSYAWVTPTFYHRPLYFEQVNLERYGIGQKRWIQPFSSAAHFFGSIGLMPYKLLTQHPGEHVYTLGHQRPGDCVAFQRKSLIGQSYPLEALRYFDDYSGYR